MKSKKVLTICIPTYNRASYISKQLSFFTAEIKRNPYIKVSVDFIIANNASTDNTANLLESIREREDFFEYYTNKDNLGLVGNIISLLNNSDTDFVWFVSDDDKLEKGIIDKILNVISSDEKLEFIFLNHKTGLNIAYSGMSGYINNGRKAALDIFDKSYGSLLLITACVYKRNSIIELSGNDMFMWLGAPLLYSFYSCGKGPIYIFEVPQVEFNPGNASYAGIKRVSRLKFEEYLPILKFLPEIGYKEEDVKMSIRSFLARQSHSHIIYNFINPINSLKIYRFYTLKILLKVPINILAFLRR